jgi:hypothetical protein
MSALVALVAIIATSLPLCLAYARDVSTAQGWIDWEAGGGLCQEMMLAMSDPLFRCGPCQRDMGVHDSPSNRFSWGGLICNTAAREMTLVHVYRDPGANVELYREYSVPMHPNDTIDGVFFPRAFKFRYVYGPGEDDKKGTRWSVQEIWGDEWTIGGVNNRTYAYWCRKPGVSTRVVRGIVVNTDCPNESEQATLPCEKLTPSMRRWSGSDHRCTRDALSLAHSSAHDNDTAQAWVEHQVRGMTCREVASEVYLNSLKCDACERVLDQKERPSGSFFTWYLMCDAKTRDMALIHVFYTAARRGYHVKIVRVYHVSMLPTDASNGYAPDYMTWYTTKFHVDEDRNKSAVWADGWTMGYLERGVYTYACHGSGPSERIVAGRRFVTNCPLKTDRASTNGGNSATVVRDNETVTITHTEL